MTNLYKTLTSKAIRTLMFTSVIALMIPISAMATIGDIKPGTPFIPDPAGNGRAIAYDGAITLYYTLFDGTSDIYTVQTDGTSLGAIPNPGRAPCGALDWDPSTSQLWCGSYDGLGDIYTIDPTTGIATLQFNQAAFGGFAADSCFNGTATGFIDGLALDDDGTLWLSDDGARTIYHVTAAGALIGSFTPPDIPGTGTTGCSTGIEVVPGGFLELGLLAPDFPFDGTIVKIEKDDSIDNPATIVDFAAPGVEDIAYDPNTFAPRCAIWVNVFGIQNPITAYDGQCTRTIGYWKNHSDDATAFLPISLGDGTNDGVCQVVDDAAEVESVLKASKGQDVAPKLKAQLLAAKLNVALGDIPPADLATIAVTIADADTLLSLDTGGSNCTPDTGKNGVDRAAAQALLSALDAFNNMYSP